MKVNKFLPIIASTLSIGMFIGNVKTVGNFVKKTNLVENAKIIVANEKLKHFSNNVKYISSAGFEIQKLDESGNITFEFANVLKNHISYNLSNMSFDMLENYDNYDFTYVWKGKKRVYYKKAVSSNFQSTSVYIENSPSKVYEFDISDSVKNDLNTLKNNGYGYYYHIDLDFNSFEDYKDFFQNENNYRKLVSIKKYIEKALDIKVLLSFGMSFLRSDCFSIDDFASVQNNIKQYNKKYGVNSVSPDFYKDPNFYEIKK